MMKTINPSIAVETGSVVGAVVAARRAIILFVT
jgi:hypothetical protein